MAAGEAIAARHFGVERQLLIFRPPERGNAARQQGTKLRMALLACLALRDLKHARRQVSPVFSP